MYQHKIPSNQTVNSPAKSSVPPRGSGVKRPHEDEQQHFKPNTAVTYTPNVPSKFIIDKLLK